MKLFLDQPEVPLSNRGLAYGDGFFETMRFDQGVCPLISYHMARMCNTAHRLGHSFSKNDAVALSSALKEKIPKDSDQQIVKVTVTREAGGRGYRSIEGAESEVFVQCFPYQPSLSSKEIAAGVQVRVCDIKLAIQPALAGLKHLNRLENVIARNEWRDEKIFEGLLLDQNGLIVETTQSNIFFKVGERWLTPELNQAGVAGVMRSWLLDHEADLNQTFHVTTLSLDDLSKAQGCFICNSVLGVIPVQSILTSDEESVSFDTEAAFALSKQVNDLLV